MLAVNMYLTMCIMSMWLVQNPMSTVLKMGSSLGACWQSFGKGGWLSLWSRLINGAIRTHTQTLSIVFWWYQSDSYRKPNPEHRWGCKPSAQPPNQSQPSHHQLISSLNACWTAMGLLRNAALKGATPPLPVHPTLHMGLHLLIQQHVHVGCACFFNTILIKQNHGCPALGDAVICIKVTNCAKPLPENRMWFWSL